MDLILKDFFMKGFDNLRSQSVAPPQWTMRNVDDRFISIFFAYLSEFLCQHDFFPFCR